MNITKRNKKIIELASNRDIKGLREFIKNDPDKPSQFNDEFFNDDEFADMVCNSIMQKVNYFRKLK